MKILIMLTILGLMILSGSTAKSIEAEDGDIIDCVDILKQPAFDHPLLKNHTIQMRPNFLPEMDSNVSSLFAPAQQVWQMSGGCLEGTVPILRTQKRASSIQGIRAKPITRVEAAGGKLSSGGPFYGATSAVSVWNVFVEPNEWSRSSMVVSKNDGSGKYVEVGVTVDPNMLGDYRTRLFLYWTADANWRTGCFNLICSGFVQVSKKVWPGIAVEPISIYQGKQYSLHMGIYKDLSNHNWWAVVGAEPVGYWPGTIFPQFEEAWEVQWAGAVLNTWKGKLHTKTGMGSGHYPEGKFGKAAYFKDARVLDSSNNLVPPDKWEATETEFTCYRVDPAEDPFLFFFGGPGGEYCN